MAVIKAINSKNSLNGIIKYVTNEEKTSKKIMTALNCSVDTVEDEMKFTKKMYNKTTGRQYKHFVQSFHPDDPIDSNKSNILGLEWAKNIFQDFEVLIVTHEDKDHIHNHFIVNSVSFKDGTKLTYSKFDLKNYKKINDEICKREGLHIVSHKVNKDYIDQATYNLGLKNQSWKLNFVNDLKKILEECNNYNDFKEKLNECGYDIDCTEKDNIKFKIIESNKELALRKIQNQFADIIDEKVIKEIII